MVRGAIGRGLMALAGVVCALAAGPAAAQSKPFLVKDINPGEDSYGNARSSAPSQPWRSDGTWAGTERVDDISPGTVGSDSASLTPVGNFLYFSALQGGSFTGRELWAVRAPRPNGARGWRGYR